MADVFQCIGCNGPPLAESWEGRRCPNCHRYYNIRRKNDSLPGAAASDPIQGEVISFQDIGHNRIKVPKVETGIVGIDYVLDGGLAPGAVILLCGDPGTGKTTMVLQMFQSLARQRIPTLYVSGEEDLGQLYDRSERLGIFPPRMQVLEETDLDTIFYKITEYDPPIIAIDSIQEIMCASGVSGNDLQPGSAMAVTTAIREFRKFGKENKKTFIIIGHVTKDGAISGPNTLNHSVDITLYFQGDPKNTERFFKCEAKNRYGRTPRISRFIMEESGLIDCHVKDSKEAVLRLEREKEEALRAEEEAKREKEKKVVALIPAAPPATGKKKPKLTSVPLTAEALWVAPDGTAAKTVLAVDCDVEECRGKKERACTSASGVREAGFHQSRVEKAKLGGPKVKKKPKKPPIRPTPRAD